MEPSPKPKNRGRPVGTIGKHDTSKYANLPPREKSSRQQSITPPPVASRPAPPSLPSQTTATALRPAPPSILPQITAVTPRPAPPSLLPQPTATALHPAPTSLLPLTRTPATRPAPPSLLPQTRTTATAPRPPPPSIPTLSRRREKRKIDALNDGQCKGSYHGNLGKALSFAGRAFLNTGQKLLQMAAEPDAGLQSFSSSVLAASKHLCFPYKGMTVERASTPQDGFVFHNENCNGIGSGRSQRCGLCQVSQKVGKKNATRAHEPRSERPHANTKISTIVTDPTKAKIEIENLRRENIALRKENVRKVFVKDLKVNGKIVSREEFCRARTAVAIMNDQIVGALEDGGAKEEVELWHIHKEHLDSVFENGGAGRGKKAPIHPMLLNWAIAFLARTSVSTYNEVSRVMKLPHISYIYRKAADMISTMNDKAYAINVDTIKEIGKQAT